jgi:hypothetical protein
MLTARFPQILLQGSGFARLRRCRCRCRCRGLQARQGWQANSCLRARGLGGGQMGSDFGGRLNAAFEQYRGGMGVDLMRGMRDVPFRPTTPTLAPGQKFTVSSSRMTLSLGALRTFRVWSMHSAMAITVMDRWQRSTTKRAECAHLEKRRLIAAERNIDDCTSLPDSGTRRLTTNCGVTS